MNIEIITTPNEKCIKSGFGTLDSCTSVLEAVIAMGHDAVLSVCETKADLQNVLKRKPELVLLALKDILIEEEESICLAQFFTSHGINFSGSLKESLLFDSDKVLAKSYLKDKGIHTPRYFTAVPGEYKRDFDIPINYPLFLKPMHSQNYNNKDELSLVNNFSEFEDKVLSLYTLYKAPILAEEYLDGEDFSVSIIKAQNGEMLVAAVVLQEPKVDTKKMFLDTTVQKESAKEFVKIEDNILKNRVEDLAIDVYIDLEIRDFGQIDIRTDRNGHCFFMEAKLVPNMTIGESSFLEAFRVELGLNYDEVVQLIVDEGISRV